MLDNSVSDHEININEYDVMRKTRNRKGGKVAMYIKSSINYKEKRDLQQNNLETITVEVSKPKSRSSLLNCWYRPPDNPFKIFNDYEESIKNMDIENREAILIGDFNSDWIRNDGSIKPQINRLRDLADAFQFEQVIKELACWNNRNLCDSY